MHNCILINLRVKYPPGHGTRWIRRHVLISKPGESCDSEILIKFAIECVKLNGGKAWVEQERLFINDNNLYIKDMFDEVMRTIFYYIQPPEVIEQVKELWEELNKEYLNKEI